MRLIKSIMPPVVLIGGLLACVSSIYATNEYAKKEKKSCTFCHGKVVKDKQAMEKNLKAVGTCYKDNGHSLAKCSAAK